MNGCLCKTCASETCWNAGHDTYIEKCSMYLHKPITNADRIRAMTDEELAEGVDRIRMYCANDLCGRGCPLEVICYSKADAPTETLDWLKEEA